MTDLLPSDGLLKRIAATLETARPGEKFKFSAHQVRAFLECAEALRMVRGYVVTMKGKGHEYQVAVDSALAKLEAL
jgi:hypothetical protein